jgi:hypothetical protein
MKRLALLLLASCTQPPRVDPNPRETMSLYLAAIMHPITRGTGNVDPEPSKPHPGTRYVLGR